jgi:bis(5'-nucleosyl)-tetraphosphatase (symmetrical)
MATYAIGDIQGCYSPLRRLLDRIQFDPARDTAWFAGDLVNRGPDSHAVLRFIKGLAHRAITVLGNHDLYLLAVAEGVAPKRAKDTFEDVLLAEDREELLTWLRQQSLLHDAAPFLMVHAGLLPQWTISVAVELAREAERVLRSDEYPGFLRTLYEPHLPRRWSDDFIEPIRLAVATVAFTRLRVCSPDGTMELSYTGPLATLPKGFVPWWDIPDRKNTDRTVVCGHWAALGFHARPGLMAMDAGCVWGRHLVAVRLEDRHSFQVDCGC